MTLSLALSSLIIMATENSVASCISCGLILLAKSLKFWNVVLCSSFRTSLKSSAINAMSLYMNPRACATLLGLVSVGWLFFFGRVCCILGILGCRRRGVSWPKVLRL